MAGDAQDKIEQFRRQQAMKRTIGQMNREGRAKVDRALAELLAQYAKDQPEKYAAERKKAQTHIVAIESAKALNAEQHNEPYTGLTEQEEADAIAIQMARNLNIIVTPIEAETREEPEAEPESPIQPIINNINVLPGAPALQPPPSIVKPMQVAIPQGRSFLENLPTPGSVLYLVLVLGFFLLAIVPMLIWNDKSYTRLQLLWRAATGGVVLPKTPYRLAIEQRRAHLEASKKSDAIIADVLRGDMTAAFWGAETGVDIALQQFGLGGADDMGIGGGVGAGQYQGYAAPQGIAGPPPMMGNPGGGWLYDDKGMLVLEQPAGSQNGRRAKQHRRAY